MKTSAPAMSDLSWLNPTPHAISHTPCNRCVRFATTVASGHATLATKRTLLLTWAGLPPAGSHQLCLAHSFDHLVGAAEQGRRNVDAEHPRGLRVDDELELGGLHDGQVGGLGALEDAAGVHALLPIRVHDIGSVAHQSAHFADVARAGCHGQCMARCPIGEL